MFGNSLSINYIYLFFIKYLNKLIASQATNIKLTIIVMNSKIPFIKLKQGCHLRPMSGN